MMKKKKKEEEEEELKLRTQPLLTDKTGSVREETMDKNEGPSDPAIRPFHRVPLLLRERLPHSPL